MSDNPSNEPNGERPETTHGRGGGLGEQYDQHLQSGRAQEASGQAEAAQPDEAQQAEYPQPPDQPQQAEYPQPEYAQQAESAQAGHGADGSSHTAYGQSGDFGRPSDTYGQQAGSYGQGGGYGQAGQTGGYYGGYPPAGGGPGGPGYGPPPPGSGGSPSSQAVGFFGALFDFSFTHFVTPIIIKVVFVVATVLIGIGLVIAIISGFASLKLGGILVLIVGPIVALFYLAIVRMTLEFYLAIVRMSEDVHKRM